MSYQVHTTLGIILRRIALESDAVYVILTSDFGIIYAKAVGVRKITSKLRFSLQQYFLSRISVIRAKHGFKITSASFEDNYFKVDSKIRKDAIANISKILEKFILSDEKHQEIFIVINAGFKLILQSSEDDVRTIESLILLSVLFHLGYVDLGVLDKKLLMPSLEILDDAKNNITEIIKIVNKGLSSASM